MNTDAECVICGKITDQFCDACGCFICPTHGLKKSEDFTSYYVCPKCKKSNKKIVTIKKGDIWRGWTTK